MELPECLSKADKLAEFIKTSPKSIRDAVYQHETGYVPRLSDKERLARMSAGELKALEIIKTFSETYQGIFSDFTAFEKKKVTTQASPPSLLAEPKAVVTEKPKKPGKKVLKEAGNLASCIASLTKDSKANDVKIASELCMCSNLMKKKTEAKVG